MNASGLLAIAAATAIFASLACEARWRSTHLLRWDDAATATRVAAIALTALALVAAGMEVAGVPLAEVVAVVGFTVLLGVIVAAAVAVWWDS